MAGQQNIDGYEVRQSAELPAKVGGLELQLIAEYRGAALAGKVIRIANRGAKAVTLTERDLSPKDALAVSIAEPNLTPGTSTTAFVVGPNGEQGHD